jgi:hypothetical protein
MGYFRFHRILQLFPGVRMNLTKGGPSLSVGVNGARVNINPNGVRTTVGIPGSGLSHIQQQSWKETRNARLAEPVSTDVPALQSVDLPASSAGNTAPEPGPRNPNLYAFGKKWFPTLARSRTNQRLPEWLLEAEQDYKADNIDRHAYELRREIILAEMSARGRGVRPRAMTMREAETLQREMMAAAVADENANRP